MLDYNGLNDPWMMREYDTGDPLKGLSEDDMDRLGCMQGFGLIVALIILVAVMVMCQGCTTTKVVEVERVRTDTVRENHTVRDSVFIHDSLYFHEWTKGDTVYVERAVWHTAIQERLRTDTVYRAKIDSIPVPYEVVKEVPRKRSWMEKTLIGIGLLSLMSLMVFVAMKVKRFLP